MQTSVLRDSNANLEKTAKLHTIINALLDRTLERGFFGTIWIGLQVQDGTIQEIKERFERQHQ